MTPPHPSRVAVIVTPGVGDDARGATVDSFVDGLVRNGHFATASSDDVTVAPPVRSRPQGVDTDWVAPPSGSQTVARRRLRRAPGSGRAAEEVDAYELHWADLSRFPVGLRRIVFTLFSLVLELARLGHEALAPIADERGGRDGAIATRSLRWLAHWMALVVVPVTALLGILGVTLTAALLAPSGWMEWALVALVGIVGVGLLLLIGRGLSHAGWAGPFGTGVFWPLVASLGVLIATWAAMLLTDIGGSSLSAALANLVVATAAWPLRIAWLILVVLWVASAIWTLILIRRSAGPEDPLRRAGFVSLLSASIPAVLLGLLSAVTLGAAATLSLTALGGRDWDGADSSLVCIGAPDDWSLGDCEKGISVEDWLIELFGRLLEPLGVAAILLAAIALFALIVLALFVIGSLLRTWGARRLPAWVTHYVPILIVARVLPGARGIPERIGGALSRLLRRLTSGWAIGGMIAIALIIAATTLVSWLITPVSNLPGVEEMVAPFGADFSGVMATALAVGLLVLRFLPNELTSRASGILGPLRAGLDIVGDVTNYIRPHETSPRFDIVSRYRALIDRIATMPHADGEVGYAGLVLVSHSQGTVYTAATLFGDDARQPSILPLADLADQDPSPVLAEMQGVAMLTCGSPIQQTYDRFFAGQYADWISRRGPDLAPVSTAWINAYRPGDYVGRAIHADPLTQPAVLVPGGGPVLVDGEASEVVEYCLDSSGSHTGYWNERDIALLANHLIERVAGQVDPLPLLPRSGAPE